MLAEIRMAEQVCIKRESDKNHSENDNPDDMTGQDRKTLMEIVCHYINLYLIPQLSNNTQIQLALIEPDEMSCHVTTGHHLRAMSPSS